MKKRILTALLIMAYAVSCLNVWAAESDVADGDVETDIRFDYVMEVYDELGIFKKNLQLFNENEVSRAHAAKLLYGMMNASNVTAEGRHYVDVKPTHDAYAEVETISSMQLMSGAENGMFYPDKAITYNEAAKTMVCALGYKELAEANGGYPTGYMLMANRKKLFKGVNGTDGNKNITGRDLAVMMYNTLRAEVMAGYAFSYSDGEAIQYKEERSDELLEIRHDMIVIKGIVEGTEMANLYGDKECAEGEVMFEGVLYDCTAANVKLGYKADAYIKDADNDKKYDTIICLGYSEDYNKTVVIDADELNGYSSLEYNYGNNKKIAITDNTQVLYNGQHMVSYDESLMKPDSGYIEFVSNGTSGEYNVIFIHDQQTLVVDKRSTANKVVIDRYGVHNTLTLDDEDDTVDLKILDGNKEITLDEILEDDVLTAEISQDKKTVRVYRSRESVSGTIKSISGNKNIKIDDTVYTALAGVVEAAKIQPGTEVTLLLDINGKVAGTSNSTDKWFFAIALASKDIAGLDSVVKIKLFTTRETEETLECADKVTLDGKKIDSSTKTNSGENAIIKRINDQDTDVIRYKTNAENKITHIDTLYTDTADEKTDGLFRMTEKKTYGYNASYYTFSGILNVGNNTTIFQINPTPTGTVSDDYKIVAASSITGNKSYEVESFADSKDAITPSIIKMYYGGTSASGISDTAKYMVVESVGRDVGSDGSDYDSVTGVWNGYSQTVLFKDTVAVKDLNEGDIIRFGQNAENYISAYEKVYDAETESLAYGSNPYGTTGTTGASDFFAALANVWRCKDGHMVVTYDDSYISDTWPANGIVWKLGSAPIYVYEKNSRGGVDVKVGTKSDIIDYDSSPSATSKVLLNVHWYGVTELYVIR